MQTEGVDSSVYVTLPETEMVLYRCSMSALGPESAVFHTTSLGRSRNTAPHHSHFGGFSEVIKERDSKSLSLDWKLSFVEYHFEVQKGDMRLNLAR